MSKQTKDAKRVTKTKKQTRLDVRCTDEVKRDFEIVAEHRGLKPAALLHSFIVKTIWETRQEAPQIFDKPAAAKVDKPLGNAITFEEAKADDEKKNGKK